MRKIMFLLFGLFVSSANAEAINVNWIVDGETYDTTTCNAGDDLILPSPPTKYGYTFQGWALYTPIEYLESTGTQWIDTEIQGPVRWVGSAQASRNTTRSQVVLMGNVSGAAGTFVGSVADKNKWTTWGTDDTGYPITSAQVFDLTWTNTGVSGTIGVTNINHDYTQGLLGTWKICSSNSSYPFAGKLYYFKAYQNGVVVRDFIPVLDQDGVPCMFDKVSSLFFYSVGTGGFIAGPVIE